MRRLLATRRTIPLDRIEEYAVAWRRIRDAVVAAGGRAWLFRGAGHEDHFLEFIEWSDGDSGGPSLVERNDVAAARTAIDEQLGGGHADEWEEADEP